jgi:hypothetical protein
MFPRVAHHPQPQVPQFEQSQSHHQTHHGLFKSLPNSPGTQSPPQLPRHGSNPQEYQTAQVPRQYAHPLQRHNSSPANRLHQNRSTDSSNSSEHMLRRKTPNGTLSAGYDGTPVEWASKPHAMKHILLPAENSTQRQQSKAGGSDRQEYKPSMPIRQPSNTSREYMPTHNHGMPNSRSVDLAGLGHDMQPSNWIFSPNQAPGMDSVLNQVPIQHGQTYYFPNLAQVPTVLQPTYQNTLGPTASHEGGPYGPYWPNGAFIPYRPAALPDPRFAYNPSTSVWPGQMNTNHQISPASNWRVNNPAAGLSSFGPEPNAFTSNISSSTPLGVTEMGMLNGNHISNPWQQSNVMVPLYNQDISTETISRPLTAIHNPLPEEDSSHSQQNIQQNSGQHLLNRNGVILSDVAVHSQKERSQEQILSWAHTVYVNLLASIHQSKRQMQQSRSGSNQHTPRTHIYPKPPRHPSISRSNTEADSSQPSERNHQQDLRASNQVFNGIFRQDQQGPTNGNPRSSGLRDGTSIEVYEENSTMRPFKIRAEPSGSPFNTIQHQISEPARTLRRTSGALISSPFAVQQLELERRAEAKEALGLLRNTCEQVGWEWIDGMLLGGCLAYGLAEYSEAVHWYTRILTRDPK